jgi:hypothetical protein
MNSLPADWAARVHLSRMAALQRRAAQHSGATRQLLEQRLEHLRRSGAEAAQGAQAREHSPPAPADGVSPLAALLAHIGRHTPPASELKAVRDYRGTWVRLGVQQCLTQTLAKVPDNAGPLNTQRLMHEALTLMGDTSPAYLQHFMVYMEALLTLDQLSPATPAVRKDGTRAPRSS